MFGIEKIISKPINKWLYNSGKNDILYTKIVLWSYFFVHLAVVSLLTWMLYRILWQKKKDKWSLIIPISCLIVTLFVPYKGGTLMEFFGGALSSPSTFSTIFAYASLLMAIGCIGLYFFDVQFTKKEGEEEEK